MSNPKSLLLLGFRVSPPFSGVAMLLFGEDIQNSFESRRIPASLANLW